MNPPVIVHGQAFLYAAYIVVWVIHCAYALTLVSRGKRLQRESRELKRNESSAVQPCGPKPASMELALRLVEFAP